MKKHIYTIGIILIGIITSCNKENIPYYNSNDNAVRFSDNSNLGYSNATSIFYKNYSFIENPLDEYILIDIPIVLIGNTSEKDRSVKYSINNDKSTAPEDTYELLEGTIPANKQEGYIRIKLYNTKGDDTYELNITIQSSDDLKQGPKQYTQAILSWNNSVPAPPNMYTIITYNMLIKGAKSFQDKTLTYYSPEALKTIISAFSWNNWNDPKAHPEYPAAYERFFIQANYQYLPHYNILNLEQSYSSFASQLGQFIEEYNSTHSEPLKHDAGALKGEPIEARKY